MRASAVCSATVKIGPPPPEGGGDGYFNYGVGATHGSWYENALAAVAKQVVPRSVTVTSTVSTFWGVPPVFGGVQAGGAVTVPAGAVTTIVSGIVDPLPSVKDVTKAEFEPN